jgi:ribonucleoside-diphosphate reductase alpha chain
VDLEKYRPGLNEDLLKKRYYQKDETSWEHVCQRVALHATSDRELYTNFFSLIHDRKFLPSRMPYMGTKFPFASSCFVFPIEDSLSGIMHTLSEVCQVQKFGGGTGINFSNLRPKGNLIATSGGEASGPVSFMGLFHSAMEVVHRAGKKHAAQMGILNCDHPDIFEFIHCKDKEGAYWTFNISVAISDAFMQAVEKDGDWQLKFGGEIYNEVKARHLWEEIVTHAWGNGDPGVIFMDTVNRHNRYPEPIEACNPCGEQMLPPHVSCNLGSIDLSRFVVDGEVNVKSLLSTVRSAILFLDGSVQNAYFPIKKIQDKTRSYRNIGLGVMGWADMLIMLGIPYASERAVGLAAHIMNLIDDTANTTSIEIGSGTRVNTTVTSIAPTGSISMLAGCSSGIEPLFGITTMKNTYVGSYFNTHWLFEAMAKEGGFYSEETLAEIARSGSIQHIDGIPANVKTLFKTTMEIDYTWHVKHQAAFQKYTDNAVSKTINLPNSATVNDVAMAYAMAFDTGCKSVTVYRDGSRQVQVMDNKETTRELCPKCKAILFMDTGEKKCVSCGYVPDSTLVESIPVRKAKRPTKLQGSTYKKETPIGTAYVTVNSEADQPFEVFLNVGKAGSEVAAVSEALGRLMSLILRLPSHSTPLERLKEIAGELISIGGGRHIGFGPKRVKSLPDGIAQVLTEHMNGQTVEKEEPTPTLLITGEICPDCGEATLLYLEGCNKCSSCGYSEC